MSEEAPTAEGAARPELDATEELLWRRAMSEAMHEAAILIDEQGRIIEWNEAAHVMFGHEREEALGWQVHALIAPEAQREGADDHLDRYLRTGQANALHRVRELQALHRDGHLFPVELSLAPLPHGERQWTVGIVREISERQRAEHAEREAEQLQTLGQIAITIAHEFNNPLAVIQTSAEMLLLSEECNAEQREAAERILAQVKRMALRVEDMRKLRELRKTPYSGNKSMIDLGAGSGGDADAPERD